MQFSFSKGARLIEVINASGHKEPFDPRKIRHTILKSGADEALADEIVKKVESQVYDGMKTGKVFDLVMKSLKEASAQVAARYDLKGSIMRLGPAGFTFETYMGEVLTQYGYEVKTRQSLRGRCATHELDLVFSEKKDGKTQRFFAECKYHSSLGIYLDLKEALYTYARFLDLVEGHNSGVCPSFDGAWLICNTRASTEAQGYADCVGLNLLCWNYPQGKGLQNLIEEKKLYPITMLRSVDAQSQAVLSRYSFLLIRDLVRCDFEQLVSKTNLPREKLNAIVSEAIEVANKNHPRQLDS